MMSLKSSLITIVAVSVFNHVQGNNCDKFGILIYEDLHCKPIKKSGLECPVKYECDLTARNNSCLFKGKNISVEGEFIQEQTENNICQSCHCVTAESTNKEEVTIKEEDRKQIKKEKSIPPTEFQCLISDCPEWFEDTPLREGCHRTFEINKCCSVGELCREDKPHVCKVDGKNYLEGQRFVPKSACSKCVCPKNFTGKYEKPYCTRPTCNAQITYQREILDNCAPFYPVTEGQPLCCPTAWVCPSNKDHEVQSDPRTHNRSDLVCRFGKKLMKHGQGFETTVRDNSDGKEKLAKCHCVLPPFLTCREISS